MSHANTKFSAGLANLKQLENQASTNGVPSALSPCNLNDKTNRASDRSKRNHHDSTKNDRSSFQRRGDGHRSSHDFVNLNEYGSIGDVIEVAFKHQHLLPQNMSAVWHRLSRLMTASNHSPNQQQERQHYQLRDELNTLLSRTIHGLKEYGPI